MIRIHYKDDAVVRNLVFVLALGDPLGSDLDLRSDEALDHVIAVQSKQEGDLLGLYVTHSPASTGEKHIDDKQNFSR